MITFCDGSLGNRKHLNNESSPKHKAVKYEFGALYRQFTPEFWYFGEFLKTNLWTFILSFCDAMDGSRHVFSCVRSQHLKFLHLFFKSIAFDQQNLSLS